MFRCWGGGVKLSQEVIYAAAERSSIGQAHAEPPNCTDGLVPCGHRDKESTGCCRAGH